MEKLTIDDLERLAGPDAVQKVDRAEQLASIAAIASVAAFVLIRCIGLSPVICFIGAFTAGASMCLLRSHEYSLIRDDDPDPLWWD